MLDDLARAVYSHLSQNPSVSQAVGGRIYEQQTEQGADVPCIVYSIGDVQLDESLTHTGGFDARLSVTVFASRDSGLQYARDIGGYVYDALHRVSLDTLGAFDRIDTLCTDAGAVSVDEDAISITQTYRLIVVRS